MRKHVKKEVLELIGSLFEAHQEIGKAIDKKQTDTVQNMLAECQEYAIHLGGIIEQMEGEGFVTVSHLEKYCEMLFHVHAGLTEGITSSKADRMLRKALLAVENSVKNDIPIRKEIVFLPYTASMWDALESVYLAAVEDPDCDAYCVPIPYFERNQDGSLGKMHYEGGEFPKDIHVTDYRSYSLEERKPDIIYIHNPYDDWNLVTCVHPDFFSSKLKTYTEKLVYIPYFVTKEVEPEDQATIDQMKHFCFLPGVIHADKVILQSEKMAQIYINEYSKAAKEKGLPKEHTDKALLAKKFLGLGSPKFDKVARSRKEDMEIPEDWRHLIEKEDGTWKKIIFYNTSIGPLLKHNEKMLIKMQDVFRQFKENREEVTLLWRPHPLIQSTLQSMRPQLWAQYQEIKQNYLSEGWGIYDDTADLDRAIAISDGYYGDTSSVVQLYQETGKPVMLQNVEILQE